MIKVDRRGLTFRYPEGTSNRVDVSFDGRRVWTMEVPQGGIGRVGWPRPIRERLRGSATVRVTDSASGAELAASDVQFTRHAERMELTDARGRWLAMNKWNRLGPVLEGRSDVVDRMLNDAAKVAELLEREGYPLYLVGGALLGLVRGGEMLPHDDDLDFAWLSDGQTGPDVALASYDMERLLVSAGYVVIRHSLAHLELEFFDGDGVPDYYIDIFTGFFEGEEYCQPFALRSDQITRDDLVPPQPIKVRGVTLPAPAHPEAWLAYAYGDGWRVPDPSFRFETPRSVQRRFESNFGVYNRGRNYWDKKYQERSAPIGSAGGGRVTQDFLSLLPPESNVLDVGCGDGLWSERIAAEGHRVLAVDYSYEALRIARAHATGAVEYEFLNLNDRASVLEFGYRMLATRTPWFVFSCDTLHTVPRSGRDSFYLLLRQILRGRTFAYVSFDTDLSRHYERLNPTRWHLPMAKALSEVTAFDLRLRPLLHERRTVGPERRHYETAQILQQEHRRRGASRAASAHHPIRRD